MDEQGISKLDLKRRNRTQILKIMKQNGAISRIDIASALKLTRAAVTIITGEMIEQGVLVELGEAQYDKNEKIPKGRKKILLDLNPGYRFAIGVSIDEKRVTAGLSTLNGSVLDKRIFNFKTFNRDEVINFIAESHKILLSNNCLTNNQVLGMGVCIHSTIEKKMGIENADFTPIENELSAKLGIPVVAEHLADYMALAYVDFRKPTEYVPRNIAFIYFATHYSLVLIDDYKQTTANRYGTDYLGNYIVNPNGAKLEGYPNGCIEAELTPAAILTKIKRVYSPDKTPSLYAITNGDFSKITLPILFEALDRGDKPLRRISLECAKMIAVFINNLACSNCPGQIVLHNFFIPEHYMGLLKHVVEKVSCKEIADILKSSGLCAECGFLGGCDLVMRKLFLDKGGYDLNNAPTK